MCKKGRLTILVAWLLGGLLLLLCPGCGSIRVARNAQLSSSLRDSLLVDYLRTELETGNLEVQQTIVEFFPPVDITPETPPSIRNPTPESAPAIGAVKSITRTELSAKREQAVVVDSSSVSGTHIEQEAQENKKSTSELNEPPTATKFNVTLKALAAVLALLIIAYGIIQYRINLLKK
ncbi:MAG: hypothetical protein IJK20_00695 [Bacteroidales bacterium]|nr:hypothetical protein [Bacteroidales bacterium]